MLISSPGDLEAQRIIAKQAIETLSLTYERRGIKIVPWLWEDQVSSEIGQPAQAIITTQLGEYDIYLGIMGARFGTPTARFGSGTEEEFNDALTLFKANGRPRLGFLFFEATLVTTGLSAGDIDQLGRVNNFQKEVGSLGLYRQFVESHTLANLVTTTVSRFVDDDHPHLGSPSFQFEMGMGATNPTTSVSRAFASETLEAFDDNISAGNQPLSLSSVWVEPEFRDLSGSDEGKSGRRLVSLEDEVAHFKTAGAGLLISGTETSGKSAICRRLFQMLFAAGHIPVLVAVERINNPDINRLTRRVRIVLAEQYENTGDVTDDFLRKRCVPIIDDWDQVKVSRSQSALLLTALRASFYGVALTVPSGYEFQWLSSARETLPLMTLRRIEIADLGNRKRYELVERWCGVLKGDNTSDTYRELVETRRKVVNRVLGSNLVPRTPLMVLVLLQAIDAGKESDLTKSGYIRYYKFLIDSTILKNANPRDAEGAYALLPEMAWETYATGAKALSAKAAEDTIERFAERKALPKSFLYNVLGNLHTIGMFDTAGDVHRFRQPYSFYFFLAEYISARMANGEMQDLVVNLCRNVSIKENATLLAFLAYHQETATLIADTLLNELSALYAETATFEFSALQVAKVNKLISDLPKAIFDENKTSERRLQRLDAEDAMEKDESTTEQEATQSDSPMRKTLTAVEILGHILRNHYARLDAAPKRAILEAASAAVLRCLADIFNVLSDSGEALARLISIVDDHIEGIAKKEDRIKRAQRAVFFLAQILVYYFPRQLARSIGDESLEITFRQALEGGQSSVTRRFLDVMLKLESFRTFPMEQLRDVAVELKTNRVAMGALRLAVAERLDMQPPNARDLQKICDVVQLSLRPRIIAGKLR